MQRDARNFSPAPDAFWPERWLIAAGKQEDRFTKGEQFVHNAAAFIPFSYGPANCVGKQLGLMEMRLALVVIMQNFKLTPDPSWDPREFANGINEWLVMTKPYLPVLVERRSRKASANLSPGA